MKLSKVAMCLLLIPAMAFASSSLWQYAKLTPPTSLAQGDIFSFTVPAQVSEPGQQISVRFRFFSTAGCTGSLGVKAYNNVCASSSRAGQTYYISQEGLHLIATASQASGSLDLIQCVQEDDNKDAAANFVDHATQCPSSSSSCTNAAGTTSALPFSLNAGAVCTP